jgi:hypothetical protein
MPSSGRDRARRQTTAGRGMERSLARIVLNCSSRDYALGKCRVLLPPEVVMRPRTPVSEVLTTLGATLGATL